MTDNQRDILLTGSVPLRPASKVFETVAKHLGPLAPRIPDGEQSGWFSAVLRTQVNHPALEVSRQVRMNLRSAPVDVYRLKPGLTARDLKLGPYGYAQNATASYEQFKKLKAEGKIPVGTRLQVTMPGPGTTVSRIELDPDELLPLAREALWREIEPIVEAIPSPELTIHLDVAIEAGHEEWRRHPLPYEFAAQAVPQWSHAQMADSVAWLANRIPAEVEFGFHICSVWHQYPEFGQDNRDLVDTANAISQRIVRPIAYIHIPIIPEHDEAADYAPFTDLRLHSETRLYLGLINLADGLAGARRRVALAEDVIPDFGVGFFCGLGSATAQAPTAATPEVLRRATPETIGDILDLHRAVAELQSVPSS